jgi:hypothetical protein
MKLRLALVTLCALVLVLLSSGTAEAAARPLQCAA